MIPRLHKRGTSFKEACWYILHDVGTDTTERVLWADTLNILSAPEDAWFEMFSVYRDQAELKRGSGQDARGRKNTKPVLHYTLSWAAGDNPSPEHMRETALSSLKAIGLEQHQVLMAAHSDKDHPHVHLIVNTIHPEAGLTAPLKYTKEKLSRWAEAYEREHGVHVEQRIKNNEARDNIRIAKNATRLLRQTLAENEKASSFVPVKHKPSQREDWLDRKDIVDRMRKLRKEIAPLLPNNAEVSDIWKSQQHEREFMDRNTEAAVDHARTSVFERYRPQWRELYRSHKKEMTRLDKNATHPFERAVFVFSHRERLSHGKPLTLRQIAMLIISPEHLRKRVHAVQQKERRSLARAEKHDKKYVSERIWQQHKHKFDVMRTKQSDERAAARNEREQQLRFVVTFDLAKQSLLAERRASKEIQPQPELTPIASQAFNRSVTTRTPTQMARVDAIKKQMEQWRAKNPGRDFDHEM